MHIRPAMPADAMPVAEMHVRSWQVGYAGLLPADALAAMLPEERAASYTFNQPNSPRAWVGVEGDAVLGVVVISPEGDDEALLMALYVDPDRWRSGVGTALMDVACAQLRADGYTSATLFVLAGNVRAEAFYRAHGWTPTGNTRRDTVWGLEVDEVEYRIDWSAQPG